MLVMRELGLIIVSKFQEEKMSSLGTPRNL